MTPLAAPLLFVALQASGASTETATTAQTTTTTPAGAAAAATPTTPTPTTPTDAVVDDGEAADLARLREIEARLAVGTAPTSDELATVTALVDHAAAARARAAAAAVLAWFDPTTSTQPLVRATRDADARVRASGAQSLVAIARRLPSEQASAVVNAAISLLDDPEDEVACAGAELLAALDPPGARQAFEVRGAAASDVRYACYVRFAGLPVRPVYMPALPALPPSTPAASGSSTSSDAPSATTDRGPSSWPRSAQPNWIFVTSAAGAGLLAGASLPTAVVSARDVLVYDDDASRLTRQEVSVFTAAAGGVVGAALLGAGAWGGEHVFGKLDDAEAIAFAGAAGAGATTGAGLGLVLGADGAGQALTLSLGTLAGVATGAGATFGATLSDDDDALVLSSAALGTMGGALAAFAAVPVGAESVGLAQRTDFGLGAGLVGGGGLALVAVAAAPFVEVKATRAAAITAGGLAGGGLLTAVGFLVVPRDLNVASRIACGMGLAGEVAGATLAGVFLPDAWLVQPGSVAVLGHDVVLGTPTLTALPPLPGDVASPLAAVVAGRF